MSTKKKPAAKPLTPRQLVALAARIAADLAQEAWTTGSPEEAMNRATLYDVAKLRRAVQRLTRKAHKRKAHKRKGGK